MGKKNNKYSINLKELVLKDESVAEKNLEFEFENHDNIFNIIDILKAKNLFDNNNESVEFAVGLKLFSEVMLKNRKHELFEFYRPGFERDYLTTCTRFFTHVIGLRVVGTLHAVCGDSAPAPD